MSINAPQGLVIKHQDVSYTVSMVKARCEASLTARYEILVVGWLMICARCSFVLSWASMYLVCSRVFSMYLEECLPRFTRTSNQHAGTFISVARCVTSGDSLNLFSCPRYPPFLSFLLLRPPTQIIASCTALLQR